MSFQTFERAFLALKKAVIGIKIDLHMAIISLFKSLSIWCANPLFEFKIQRVITKKRKTPNFSFLRGRAAADLH